MHREPKAAPLMRAMTLIGCLLGLAGCGAATPTDPTLPMTVAPATVDAWHWGPVWNKQQAAITGEHGLEVLGLYYAEPPLIIYDEEMSFSDAQRRAGLYGGPGYSGEVWLVLLEGDYQIFGPPTAPPTPPASPGPVPFVHGCAAVIIAAAEGRPLQMRGPGTCAIVN